jgi:exonuclease III
MIGVLLAVLSAACPPVTQKVMVFNVEYGGALVDFGKTVEAIERAAPDLVLVEEAWGQIPRLAQTLGWTEYDVRHQVLSRRAPLLDPPDAVARFLYAELAPGCVAALANVHLPSDPDIPEPLEEAQVVATLAAERTSRLRALEPTLQALRPLQDAGIPVLLGGDFNAPSHLDDPRPWPVSLAIEAAGLRDLWRTAHPDAKSRPGYTWWAARPQVDGWNPSPQALQVRIDQLHGGGRVEVKDARIVGETGRPGVDIGVSPWPSDHRGLVFTLDITPGPPPVVVTAWPARVVRGKALRVRARGVDPGARVVVAPAGVDPSTISAAREVGSADLNLPTQDLRPGVYQVVLFDRSGRLRSAASFAVVEDGAQPSVTVARQRLRSGEAIEVRWANAPGFRWDWVGVYPQGLKPDAEGQPLLWRHTRATVAGGARLDAEAEGEGWPLKAGSYEVYLFEDDAYRPLAGARLVVEP